MGGDFGGDVVSDEAKNDLPILEAVKPIAKCGFCGNDIYPDSQCQNPLGIKPACCPLNGDEWRSIQRARSMQNVWSC